MTRQKKDQHMHGDNRKDLQDEIEAYSKKNMYIAEHYANAKCSCEHEEFYLLLDDNEGAAVRVCASCKEEHPICDSADYLEDAELEECACPCGNKSFEISVGVSLYPDSEDVKWLYIGGRCPKCGLCDVYGDWKNEYDDYKELLNKV